MESSSIDNDLERRLNNWARWVNDSGPHRSAAISGVYRGGPRSRRAEPGIPLISGEAAELDTVISGMSTNHRDALRAHYCRRGPDGAWLGTMPNRAVAARLGCAVTTLHDRLASARRRLVSELADRRRAAARQREAWRATQQ